MYDKHPAFNYLISTTSSSKILHKFKGIKDSYRYSWCDRKYKLDNSYASIGDEMYEEMGWKRCQKCENLTKSNSYTILYGKKT